MESAELDQVTVDIAGTGVGHRATGSVLKFDGFLKLYQEDRDDPAEDEEGDSRLPELKAEQPLERKETKPEQHFTQPPPRYSEASLVKRLEASRSSSTISPAGASTGRRCCASSGRNSAARSARPRSFASAR
jgi:DNA topoisomerase IA